MRRYTIAMSVRMLCLVLGVFTEGLLMWIFFAGAIFLPYFAVVLANVQSRSPATNQAVSPTLAIRAEDLVMPAADSDLDNAGESRPAGNRD